MKASIIAIGNSRGVRIPKPLLEESQLGRDVEIKAKRGEIKITPLKESKGSDNFSAASDEAFAKDWLRPEEEEAWKVYQ